MLEMSVAVVCLAIGFVGGIYARRNAIADFERGVSLGLTHATTLVKSHANVQQPRHDNRPPQQNPDKK